MIAESAEQRRLLDVAALDTELTQLLHRRRTLPEHEEINKLAEQRKAASTDLVAANTVLSDAQYALDKAGQDIEPVRSRIERDQQRLDTGAVSDAKVVSDLVAGLETLRKRLVELEDLELEAMQSVEDATTAQQSAQAVRDELDAKLTKLVSVRDEKVKELDEQIAQRRIERRDVVCLLPTPLMELYERVRERTGQGAALLQRGRCLGCQLELNAADLRRFASAAANEVVRCEECGRILVRTEESGL